MVARLAQSIVIDLDGNTATHVDVSTDVDMQAGIKHTWGRSDPLAPEPDAGQLTFTLDNADGRYTPGNPRGVYVVGIEDGRLVTWTAGTRVRRFQIQTAEIVFANGSPGSGQVVVRCVDVLGRAAQRQMRSAYDEDVLYRGFIPGTAPNPAPPVGYWKLDEGGQSTSAANSSGVGSAPLVAFGDDENFEWGSGQAPPSDGSGSLVLNTAQSPYLPAYRSAGAAYLQTAADLAFPSLAEWEDDPVLYPGEYFWKLQMWFKAPFLTNFTSYPEPGLWSMDFGGGQQLSVWLKYTNGTTNARARLWYTIRYSTGVEVSGELLPAATDVLPYQTHQIGVQVWIQKDAALGDQWTIDTWLDTGGSSPKYGSVALGTRTAPGSGFRPVALSVGRGPERGTATQAWIGTIGRVVLWPNSGSGQAGDSYVIGATGVPPGPTLAQNYSMHRVGWLLQRSEIYSLQRISAPAAQAQEWMGPQDTAGKTLLTCICDALRAERAVLWADTTGLVLGPGNTFLEPIKYKMRSQLHPHTVSMVLDIAADLASVPQLVRDVPGQVTSATASTWRQSVVYEDASLVDIGGKKTATVDAANRDTAVLSRLAEERVTGGRSNQFHAPSLQVDRLTLAVDKAVHLLTPGERIRLDGMPAAIFGQASADHYLIGGAEEYSVSSELVTLNLESADAPAEALVDPDAASPIGNLYWRTSCDGYTLASAITSTATVLRIQRPAGEPAFSTDVADYAMRLDLRGEKVLLNSAPTTISATVQEFSSVTRAAGGTLARAHAAGEPVDISQTPSTSL